MIMISMMMMMMIMVTGISDGDGDVWCLMFMIRSFDPQVALVIEPLPDKRKTSLNVVPQSL